MKNAPSLNYPQLYLFKMTFCYLRINYKLFKMIFFPELKSFLLISFLLLWYRNWKISLFCHFLYLRKSFWLSHIFSSSFSTIVDVIKRNKYRCRLESFIVRYHQIFQMILKVLCWKVICQDFNQHFVKSFITGRFEKRNLKFSI